MGAVSVPETFTRALSLKKLFIKIDILDSVSVYDELTKESSNDFL